MQKKFKVLYLFGFLLLSQNHFQCTPILADADKINAISTIEKDSVEGFTNEMLLEYGFRMYNPNIGRFVGMDTLNKGVTPYEFVENNNEVEK